MKSNNSKKFKTYLGDSVYLTEGSYLGEFILTTENGLPDDPSNKIIIDFEILENLNNVINYLKDI